MLATVDNNPFPLESRSYQIWQRNNHESPIKEANDRDRHIIYLYVMEQNMSKIARLVGLSDITIRRVLQKYHII